MKKVLVLGASGQVAAHTTPGLESHYDLYLGDVRPHPFGKTVHPVDITQYEQVRRAAAGIDAVMDFAAHKNHPVMDFEVSTKGAFHVMRAAVEHGIKKVIIMGPQLVRGAYDEDFDIDDVPPVVSTGYNVLSKYLSIELCKAYARAHGIETIFFLFNGLGPKPAAPVTGQDFPPMVIVWEDLHHACRLALEIASVPDHCQVFHMLSYSGHGKYLTDKAKRMLGYAPLEPVERYYRRIP
ncbi:MAG: NAD(P)-dependent oxidoreductase [candidate division Zixibacteria bacterium]|nr:NAD(P)-dependent oxidoreductase [candidate division Zixibacteria bacterium]